MTKKQKTALLKMHRHIVYDVLNRMEIPFAEYTTHYFKKGDTNIVNGKKRKVECGDDEMFISSYVDVGGQQIRISNHKKGRYEFPGIEVIYDKDTGKYDHSKVKPL